MAKGCSIGANGHCQSQAWRATGYVAIPATFTSLGNIQPLGMPLATKREPAEALVAGLFGFPQIANCFVFNIPNKAASRRFDGAAPGENLKRILNERRIEVNRKMGHRQPRYPTKQQSRSLTARLTKARPRDSDGMSRGMEFRLRWRVERDKARSEMPALLRAAKLPRPNTTPTQRRAVPRAEPHRC